MTKSKKVIITKKLKLILLKKKEAKSKKKKKIQISWKWVAITNKKKKKLFFKSQLKKAIPKINLSKDRSALDVGKTLWWQKSKVTHLLLIGHNDITWFFFCPS